MRWGTPTPQRPRRGRTMPRDEARAYLRGLSTARYRRCSRLRKEAYGPEAQDFDIDTACEERGMLVPHLAYEDWVTASGKVTRSQFEGMLRDARAGKFRVLVIGRVDRFARNEALGWIYLYDLIAAGVIVYFARKDIAA